MDAPDLGWLRAFAAFGEELNFTRAAARLHLSQPAVHVQVRKLSEHLGKTLYVKRGRRLELTEDGRRTLAFARELLERCARFGAELRGDAEETPAALSAGEGACLYLLGPGLRAFLAGGDRLRLFLGDAERTLDAVRTGEAHVGVAPIASAPPDLDVAPLAVVGQHLVLPPDHPLATRPALDLADLEGARLIVPPAGRPQRVALDDALAAAGVHCHIAVEARGWPLALHLAALGVGLALVNDFCPPPPGLTARPVRGLAPRTYAALRLRAATPPPAARRLWAALDGG